MREFLLRSALLLTTGVAGCFQVDLASVVLKCDPTMPNQPGACPDGEQCSVSQGICVPIGGSTTPVSDMGVSQLDFGPVATPACPSGMGYDVTLNARPKVYACQVTYTNQAGKTADLQCLGGYSICTIANNVNLKQCDAVGARTGGFFIANVPIHRNYPGGPLVCGSGISGYGNAWAGCGSAPGTAMVNTSCSRFTAGEICQATSSFTCANTGIGDITNTDPNSGVLCCHP